MPEGLNKQNPADPKCPSSSPITVTAQSVPDLLILPGQDVANQSTAKQEKHLKPSISLSRAVSVKASLVKNAIMSGLRRKGILLASLLASPSKYDNMYINPAISISYRYHKLHLLKH